MRNSEYLTSVIEDEVRTYMEIIPTTWMYTSNVWAAPNEAQGYIIIDGVYYHVSELDVHQ